MGTLRLRESPKDVVHGLTSQGHALVFHPKLRMLIADAFFPIHFELKHIELFRKLARVINLKNHVPNRWVQRIVTEIDCPEHALLRGIGGVALHV